MCGITLKTSPPRSRLPRTGSSPSLPDQTTTTTTTEWPDHRAAWVDRLDSWTVLRSALRFGFGELLFVVSKIVGILTTF